VATSLVIGCNSGLSHELIGYFKKVSIGKNVKVGANILVTDSDWHLDD
jgi:hypothetical protein